MKKTGILILLTLLTGTLSAEISTITTPASGKTKDIRKKFRPIITHMEFLGYTTVLRKKVAYFKHPKLVNLLLRRYRGGFLFTSTFRSTPFAKKRLNTFRKICNVCSGKATMTKFYLDKDNDFIIEAWFPGEYEKKRFALFINTMNSDWRNILRMVGKTLMPFLK